MYRILFVLLMGLGLVACDNGDSSVKPAITQSAPEGEDVAPEGEDVAPEGEDVDTSQRSPSGFLESAQQAVSNAKKAAEEMEAAAQGRVDQIDKALDEGEDE